MSDATTSGRLRWFASSGFGMFTLGVAIALGFAFAAQSVSRAMITMRTASTIKVKGTASIDVVTRTRASLDLVCVDARAAPRCPRPTAS